MISAATVGEVEILHGFAAVGSGKVEELPDDAIHFLDVRCHAVLHLRVTSAHLDAEPQARERRAQIVRDPGQNQRAVLVEP